MGDSIPIHNPLCSCMHCIMGGVWKQIRLHMHAMCSHVCVQIEVKLTLYMFVYLLVTV